MPRRRALYALALGIHGFVYVVKRDEAHHKRCVGHGAGRADVGRGVMAVGGMDKRILIRRESP